MRNNIFIIMLSSFALIAPARAIYCVTCSDCLNQNTLLRNTSCSSGQDTCIKLDFGPYVYKLCGTQYSMCPSTNAFKTASPSQWSAIQVQVGNSADTQMNNNKNNLGHPVLHCCSDRDYCNNGMHKTVSVGAVLGMALVYILA